MLLVMHSFFFALTVAKAVRTSSQLITISTYHHHMAL